MKIDEFLGALKDFDTSSPLGLAIVIVAGMIAVVGLISLVVSIWLAFSYMKYNRTKNSLGLNGEQIARQVLDQNGLSHIKVSASGSVLFGNSYSHYFKKVRLRRLTWHKDSVASMAMATQKSSLAILDKQGDPDMKARIRMTPIIYIGPIAFIPLILVGVVLDAAIFHTASPVWTIAFSVFGLLVYILSFFMSLKVLKTETKAQKIALDMMKNEPAITAGEVEMCEKLYRLYNIEYVNNLIMSMLEILFRVLQIVYRAQSNSNSSSSSK